MNPTYENLPWRIHQEVDQSEMSPTHEGEIPVTSIKERRESISDHLRGIPCVIIEHSYQDGIVKSVFSKDEDWRIIRSTFERYLLYVVDDLSYDDAENGVPFHGNRLRDDMVSIGYHHIITFTGQESLEYESVRRSNKMEIENRLREPGQIVRMRNSSTKLASVLIGHMIDDLMAANYLWCKESDLYPMINEDSVVRTDHPRTVQVATGEFISHPLCCKCGAHTGMCRMSPDYADAIEWADAAGIPCEKCCPKPTKKQLREAEEMDWDNDEGYCSCPLEVDI